jgi:hypothetical protein
LAEEDEFCFLLLYLLRRFEEIGHQNHICVDDAQQAAIAVFTRQLEHGRDERRAVVRAFHIRQVRYAQFFRGFSYTCLITDEQNFDIGQGSPRLNRIALNGGNVWVSKRFGGGEKGNKCHDYLS